VTGEMELRRHGAGLVSSVDGTLTLEGILVSTAITFKANDGNTYGGGVIGHANSSTLNLNGVVFSGHLKAADNSKERLLGGIIGWGDNYTATLNNVLFCGTREGETPFVPIAGKWGEGHVTITVNNVFTTEGQYGIGDANNFLVAWEGDKIVARNRVEKLGALTNDFKVVTVYEHGVSVNNKYYGPVWKLFGEGTQADPYIIEENAEWIYIVDQSYKGNTFNNRHLKMMNDISANRHYHGCFKGTFDGGGHTLHYDHMLVPDRETVFQDIEDATICNLKLTGSMNSASTLIGGCAGTVTLENVVVSTNLERSSDLFEAHVGGIIGWAGNATLNLRGVVFNGNINIKSELWTYVAMYYLAGIISSGDNYTANMRDVIFCGNAYDNNVAFTPIAWANKGANPKFNFHNVITTKSPVRCGERKPEAPCRKCRIDRTAAHCGNLVKDYGLLQAYDYGIKVGDLYYAYDPMQGQGTAEDPFLITNAEDWEKTATYNSEGSTFTSQHLKVTADFATDKCFEQSFSGNIDFGSHTITANVQNAETEYAALFRNTYDATIRNLKMAGDMTVGKYGAALVGGSDGDLTLENIVVSANVNYKSDNGLYGGGVIGHAGSSTLDLSGVVFTGKMTPMDNHEDELLGGIVGWGDSYTATMKDILFCGTYAGEKIFTPIAAKNDEAAVEATVDNVFYTQRGKNADPEYIAVGGKKAALNDNASNIGSMIFDYGLLQAYESGLGFDGNFYCEETPTGIDEIENGKFSPGECGDGMNSENSDAQWFSLDGRKLAGKPTKKGLYIVNGRKAIVR